MKFALGIKKEMTQKFSDRGEIIPATAVQVPANFVTQVKNDKRDGYVSVQVGAGLKKKMTKPLKGHLKDLDQFRYLKEFRVDEATVEKVKRGDRLSLEMFEQGDKLELSGRSKGKGFQGVVKRHGFSGSPASHGHKDQLRMPGSSGATDPNHVFKGKRMGGHMGYERVTVKDMELIEIDLDKQTLWLKGPVPGAFNSLVMLSAEGEVKVNQVSPNQSKQDLVQAVGHEQPDEAHQDKKEELENKTEELEHDSGAGQGAVETGEKI